jgi:hypothetical protein
LQVSTLDNDYTINWSTPRQDSDLLSFMKLDPERMLASGAGFAQPQITFICDFSDSKCRAIEGARNYAFWRAAAFAQHEVAECVAFPTRQGPHDHLSRTVLATRRSIKTDPFV